MLFVAKARETVLLPNHCEGPPALVIEVVAPESFTRDWRDKYIDYEAAGVREYWIIDRTAGRVEAYSLGKGGKYRLVEERDGKLASAVLPGFHLRPKWVVGGAPPSRRSALCELGVKG